MWTERTLAMRSAVASNTVLTALFSEVKDSDGKMDPKTRKTIVQKTIERVKGLEPKLDPKIDLLAPSRKKK